MTTEKTNEDTKTPKSERIEDNAEHALRLEVETLRANRDTLARTNRELSIVAVLFDELLEGLEEGLGAFNGGKRAERSVRVLHAAISFRTERNQFVRQVASLEKEIELFHDGQSVMDLLEKHEAEKADLEKALELAKTVCYRELARKKELSKQNRELEAALDEWEKFGLEVRDKVLATAEINGGIEIK